MSDLLLNQKKFSFLSLEINNLKSLGRLAKLISNYIEIGDVITLRGDIGIGKTTFARLFISSIAGYKEVVPSPTFNLALNYSYDRFNIWHFDLYRLSNCEEIWDLGIEEAFLEGISLIEWPDIMQEYLPENILDIYFYYSDPLKENCRKLVLKGYGNWFHRIEKIDQGKM